MSQPHEELDRGSTTTKPPGTPRWVKVFVSVVAIMVLLVVIMLFASGGRHGPGRHLPSGGTGGSTSPIAHTVQQ